MRTDTVIDTIALQIDYKEKEECRDALYSILEIIRDNNYYVKPQKKPKGNTKKYAKIVRKVYHKNNVIISISKDSFSYTDKEGVLANTTYYLSIKLAGLKSYNAKYDVAIYNLLLRVVAYFRTRYIPIKITQLDIALDMFTKFYHVLALCIKKSPKTDYYGANEDQPHLTTTYLEKLTTKNKNNASLRSCVYDKQVKNNLAFRVTRFEISLQRGYLKKHNYNIDLNAIFTTLDRYSVMYVANKKIKQEMMDKYDAIDVMRDKERAKLNYHRFRCFFDYNALIDFVMALYSVNESNLHLFVKHDKL
jgi:hypothetical protein